MILVNFKKNFSYFILISLFMVSLYDANCMHALNTAATGMSAQEAQVNTIANNIANVNTIGFKRGRVEFQDLSYKTEIEAGARTNAETQNTVGVQYGSGVRVGATKKEYSQGGHQMTNNPFDLLINGEGFFAVTLANGTLGYTRDGAFSVNAQGQIVSKLGYALYPGFTLPPNTSSVNIAENGTFDVYITGQIEPINLGSVALFTFVNPAGLKSTGGNLLAPTSSSGVPLQSIAGEGNAGIIVQGALEASNVNIMTEMTDLIRAQRAYEMNAKVMGAADQMLQTTNNIRQ